MLAKSEKIEKAKNITEDLVYNINPEEAGVPIAGEYLLEDKVRAVIYFNVLKTLKEVYRITAIPYNTLLSWKKQEWWDKLEQQVITARNKELDTMMTNIMHKSMDELQDRLEYGDEVYNYKTGEMVRKKVGAKELATIVSTVWDKRELGRGNATSRSESISREEGLEKIEEQFKKFANAREIDGEAVREEKKNEEGED